MPKKKSVKKAADRFLEQLTETEKFVQTVSPSLSQKHESWVYELAIVRIYRSFEQLMLEALVGAINNDTLTISARTGFEFPKHLTDEVCEYLIAGGGYFDFKGRDGLIKSLKQYVPDNHYLLVAIKRSKYKDTLERLSAFRNYASHDSAVAKRSALTAVGQTKIGSAGAWLKAKGRLSGLCSSMRALGEEIKKNAPY